MTAVLAIDTTTRFGSVALAEDGIVRAVVHHDPQLGYAESLLALCDAVCARARCDRDALDGVAVVRGPGSFTGLRIGIMTAKALAFARSWLLWTADSLPLLAAASGQAEKGLVVALLDAGAGHVFTGVFEPGRPARPAQRVALDDLPAWGIDLGPPGCLATEAALVDAVGTRMPDWSLHGVDSLAATLARVASRDQEPAVRVDPDRLVPLYVSPSQAERARGIDLRDRVHRRIPPTGWE